MKNVTKLLATLFIAISFLGTSDVLGQTCPDGMITYLKLQEPIGPNFSDSYGDNDAFSPGASPTATRGISGNAQQFNHVNSSYIAIPDQSEYDWGGGSNFSIEFWVKFSGNTGNTQVFVGRDEPSNQMQWWIGSTVTGNIMWFLQSSDGSNGSITTDGSFNNGSWNHVVAVRDGTGGRIYLYVNGTLQNTGGTGLSLGGSLAATSPITLGSLTYNGSPDYFATAALDEVAIYSKVLDANDDIIPHYNNLRLYQIGYCDGDDPYIFSEPVTEAVVGQLYSYIVDASGNSLPTYELLAGPTGMTINQTTGQINWTPTSISQNGRVLVKAVNDKGSVEQEFNIYIADIPTCRNNLIAYWDFNSGDSPPIFDKMANYQLTGAGPTSVPGLSGNALLFDGTNDSVNMHDTFSPDRVFFDFDDVPNFSIEMWVKTSATPTQTMVMVGRDVKTNSSQYWVGINPDGTVGFYLRDWPASPDYEETYLEGGSVLDGNWHHIVASYSNTERIVRLYVDKVKEGETTGNFYNFGGSADLNIGMLNTTMDKYWYNGLIDELAFYNTTLSSGRVTENYNSGIAGLGACVYNHAPVISSTPETTVEQDATYNYVIEASEIDAGDVLTISAVTKPDWLSFTYTTGAASATLSGQAGNDDVGIHNVTIRASDGSANVDQVFTVEVLNVNDAPVITSSPILVIDQGGNYSYTVIAEDPDGDVLSYSAPMKPVSFAFNSTTHILSGIPTNDDVPSIDITISVTDGTAVVEQIFQVTVNNVNDAPVITSSPLMEIFQGEDYNYTIIANDPDGDDLTYAATILPGWLNFDANTHRLNGSTSDFVGVADVTLTVSDGIAIPVEQVFQIEVKNVNDLPEVTSTPITTATVGESYLYQMEVTDNDPGDVLSFSVESKPTWLAFVPASNSAILSGIPAEGDKGSHSVIIKVGDGTGEVIHAFSISVGATGIENDLALSHKVFPNPAKDMVYFEMLEKREVVIEIFDITGISHKLIQSDGSELIKIDISDLPKNLYLYKISVDNRSVVGKLLKD